MTALLVARGISKSFRAPGGSLLGRSGLGGRSAEPIRAVDGVDLTVEAGECVALVGESGSGKTTLGRCLLRLVEPDRGEIRFRGEDLLAVGHRELRARRRDFQMVFQDPYDSLSPRMRVGEILAEPLAAHRIVPRERRRERVAELLERVGLPSEAAGRYPHEFSGGQRQRIGIARALATEPALLVADEPVSALDVSVSARVLELLGRLRRELDLAVLLIAHDLAMVERTADRVLVMHAGKVVERGPVVELFAPHSRSERHPYTRELLAAVPRLPPPPGRPGADGGVPQPDVEPPER